MLDFNLLIINWYRQNKRNLPWRETSNPYYIWLSEIILQQTRVDQGLSYYYKFINHYPNIHDLANSSEQEILNDWQGLGYYSRARNIHFTAKYISSNLNGEFPSNYADLIQLKGVGEYTAAAIASFAYKLPYAVLDGNVFRVLSRVFNISEPINETIGKKLFKQLSQDLLPINDSDIYNQGIMEFGALQCTPKNPNCSNCCLNHICLAFQNKTVDALPIKTGKINIRKRYFYYFILNSGDELIINQRTKNDIWQQLFEFPLIETENELSEQEVLELATLNYHVVPNKIHKEKKHILSHQHIYATFIHIGLDSLEAHQLKESEQIIKTDDLSSYPIPRLIDRYLIANC
jgi:A/G-specific adenine glycosylase